MKVVGVIAEYNPFHQGHAWQLRQARALSGADWVVVVMSGCFTQRGDGAILSPAARTRMALADGADAVLLLPTLWAVRDAEHFALGGVRLLSGIGADAISFGAESADLPRLTAAAHLLEHPTALQEPLHAGLSSGLPYPAALHRAVTQLDPALGDLLSSPNNTLAVCYLRAMQRLGANMTAYPVARESAYHATSLDKAVLPSATALRAAIHRGDWTSASSAMPPAAHDILRREALAGRVMREDGLDQALLYRLRTMAPADYDALPDCSEGIQDRLRAAASRHTTRADVLTAAKTRRYPYARLSRLCTDALLNMTQATLDETLLPPAAWLLGFREDALPLLAHMKRAGLPLIGKAADYPHPSEGWFQLEQRAYDLWATGCHLPAGLAMTQGVVRAKG